MNCLYNYTNSVNYGETIVQAIYTQSDLANINKNIFALVSTGIVPEDIGNVCNPVHCEIDDYDSHAIEKLKERGITLDDAQDYINNAVIMFEQDGSRSLYLSREGGSVLVSNCGRLITAYPKDNFKKHTHEILKVVLRYENNENN